MPTKAQLTSKNKQLLSENSALSNEVTNLKEKLSEKAVPVENEQLKKLKQTVTTLKKEADHNNDVITSLEDSVKTLKGVITQRNKDIKSKDNAYGKLSEKVDNLKSDLSSIRTVSAKRKTDYMKDSIKQSDKIDSYIKLSWWRRAIQSRSSIKSWLK